MDRSSFRNIFDVCYYFISFILKIPKIVESQDCRSVRTVISAHVPVFEHSETQYLHDYKSLRPCYLPSAKNFYKHYLYVILFTRSFYITSP